MPVKKFLIGKKVNKKSGRLPSSLHKKIDKVFDELKKNPLAGVKLHGELSEFYKFRIGDYRVIYKFDRKKGILEVVKIEHRQGVYK